MTSLGYPITSATRMRVMNSFVFDCTQNRFGAYHQQTNNRQEEEFWIFEYSKIGSQLFWPQPYVYLFTAKLVFINCTGLYYIHIYKRKLIIPNIAPKSFCSQPTTHKFCYGLTCDRVRKETKILKRETKSIEKKSIKIINVPSKQQMGFIPRNSKDIYDLWTAIRVDTIHS